MTGWSSATLGVICRKIGSGATPTGGSNAYQEAGIPLIRSQNVLDFSFSEDGLAFINDDQAYELRNVTVEEKDVLLNITGDSVARCCVVPKSLTPARVNQHVAIIRPIPEKASHLFIFYLLQQMKEELLMKSEIGATRRALTKGMLENLEIELPPLPEQKAIAAVLSSLDDKIDLLHRQNRQFSSQLSLQILGYAAFFDSFAVFALSGFNNTSPITDQSLVFPLQRSGCVALARA